MRRMLAGRRGFVISAVACAAAAMAGVMAAPDAVMAQSFPDRSIKLVVPFPPGGALDVLARIVGQKMGEDLGQQLVVENKPGATGHLGSEAVATAPADGYTLLFTASSTQVVSAQLMKLNYKPMEDLVPIGLAATVDNIIVIHPSLPIKSVKELVDYAKANPDKLVYASTGVGSNLHLAGELLNIMGGIKMRHVPYSSAQMIPDLLAGRVQLMVGNIPQVAPHVAEGKLRAIAATSLKRVAEYPDLPTVAEALPGYEVIAWGMMMAPKATPAAVVAKLNASLVKAIGTPEVTAAFKKQSFNTAAMSPEKSAEFMKVQWDRWARVIKEANIPPVN